MSLFRRIVETNAPATVIFIRLLVGAVFLSEGIQKFLFPAELGAGRFMKIGIPAPELMAPFVGIVEIVCGAMLLCGLLTRIAAIDYRRGNAVVRLPVETALKHDPGRSASCLTF
jgi:putative oxidoreductase